MSIQPVARGRVSCTRARPCHWRAHTGALEQRRPQRHAPPRARARREVVRLPRLRYLRSFPVAATVLTRRVRPGTTQSVCGMGA